MDFTKIRNYLFLGLLLLVTVSFLAIIQPFAYPIFWAAVIAALFSPFYKKVNGWLKHANLSATITLAAVVVVILVPLAIIGVLLIREAILLYGTASADGGQWTKTFGDVANFFKYNTYNTQLHIDEQFWATKFAETSQYVLDFIFKTAANITQNSLKFLAMFIIMLYALFFFIRDGAAMLQKLLYLSPLGDKYEVMLYKKFTTAASAIVKGTLILGGIQGAIGGIAFAVAGVEGALIWAIIMTLFSVIPGVGASIIWFPAGLLLLVTGSVWQGIMVLIVGFLIISTVDNLLRPLLVGKKLEMHPLIIFFSTLGGILLFNVSGFMIGPIIAALFLAFWQMYQEFYKNELEHN